MSEKHTCKICSVNVSQLSRHLTMKHDKMILLDYLTKFNCGEEYTIISNALTIAISKNSPWSSEFYISRGYSKYGGFINKIHPLLIGAKDNLLPKKKTAEKGNFVQYQSKK